MAFERLELLEGKLSRAVLRGRDGGNAILLPGKLHLAAVVAAVWIPLAADLTPANAADNEQAPALIRELPLEVRYVLGDVHYNDPELRQLCDDAGRFLVTTRRGPYPHTDGGVEVRRVFHKLRSVAMENLNEHVRHEVALDE